MPFGPFLKEGRWGIESFITTVRTRVGNRASWEVECGRLLNLPKQELISHPASDGAGKELSTSSLFLQTRMGKVSQAKSICPERWRKSQPLLKGKLQGRGEASSPELQVALKGLEDSNFRFLVSVLWGGCYTPLSPQSSLDLGPLIWPLYLHTFRI